MKEFTINYTERNAKTGEELRQYNAKVNVPEYYPQEDIIDEAIREAIVSLNLSRIDEEGAEVFDLTCSIGTPRYTYIMEEENVVYFHDTILDEDLQFGSWEVANYTKKDAEAYEEWLADNA